MKNVCPKGETYQLANNNSRSILVTLHLFTRAYHRILKLSRTIADLAGSDRIEAAHLAEAVQYRPRQLM